jgi:cyclophilin family peptidyl-prolyl cis-trans isomerase
MNKHFLALFAATLLFSGCSGDMKMAVRSTTDDPAPVESPAPVDAPASAVEAEEMPALAPVPTAEADNEQVAVITTKFGKIVIELAEADAPLTTANFKKLIGEGFYNGTTFHRVISGFMIQGGDPNSKNANRKTHGLGGPGYTIPAEIKLKHVRGSVATARLGDDHNPSRASSGSQFFICVADCPSLDGGYTVFGKVIRGMDVADLIVAQERDPSDNPVERIEMQVAMMGRSAALKD